MVKHTKATTPVAKMLKRLKQTPARVGVSRVAGVGLIAVRHIKKGEKLYSEGNAKAYLVGGGKGHFCDSAGIKHLKLPAHEVEKLENKPGMMGIADMVDAYIPSYEDDDGEEVYPMPETGLDRMHPVWYMNDGGNNCQNCTYLNQHQMFGGGITPLRDIKPGEELFLNYGEISAHQQGGQTKNAVEWKDEEYFHDKAWTRAKMQVDKLRENAALAHRTAALEQMRLAKAEGKLGVAARRAGRGGPGMRRAVPTHRSLTKKVASPITRRSHMSHK